MRFCDISYFVTLTYNDDNLIFADDEPCLFKRDLQLHFKKLRKHLEPRSIKYYAVGEYGDRGNRPHYHYLIFYRGSLDRFRLMNLIKDNWEKGFSQVLPIHGAQGYVTKYVLKFDERDHIVKPFAMISHGLGIDYLSQGVIKYHKDNLIPYALKPGGYRISLPRFYKVRLFSMFDRLLMKKRSDLYRRELEYKRLDSYEFMIDQGINPFAQHIASYQNKLYQSMKLYRQKKKL